MIFLLHSGIDATEITAKLGKPEYSYFFVLDGFRKALDRLGRVIMVDSPETKVDKIQAQTQEGCLFPCFVLDSFRKALDRLGRIVMVDDLETKVDKIHTQAQEDCIFLCFAPPNHAPIGLNCPTLSVFAWEFSNIPYETWNDDPRNDWRYVLRDHGRTITLSNYSAQAVREAMGPNFPVAAIPVPVWDQYEDVRRELKRQLPVKSCELVFTGELLDSNDFSLQTSDGKEAGRRVPEWDNEDFTLKFEYASPDIARLNGFYVPEEWGAWSRVHDPFVELPYALSGVVTVIVEAHGYHTNIGGDITVTLGSSRATLRLSGHTEEHVLSFVLPEPASRIYFRGLETIPPPDSEDRRTLGIGLVSINFSRVDAPGNPPVVEQEPASGVQPNVEGGPQTLRLSGVVYTSVFNPGDGRKNWIDLVTAFCYAHRSNANTTLILKMVTNDPDSYMGTLRLLLTQLAPFNCRIVAIRGFLPTQEYKKLMAATTYYVNTSHCEGLCLPLMEFLCCGIPAVAPDHTAMADYINTRMAFPVESSIEQNVWPEDTRDLFRTLRYRINWESLRDGFLASYRVATEDTERYRRMSEAAHQELGEYCSVAAVTRKLSEFLKTPALPSATQTRPE